MKGQSAKDLHINQECDLTSVGNTSGHDRLADVDRVLDDE